jgi:hypothetical protein
MNIRFLTLAQKEVDESVRWYDEQANLGRGFLDENNPDPGALPLAITCRAFSVRSGALADARATAPITRW